MLIMFEDVGITYEEGTFTDPKTKNTFEWAALTIADGKSPIRIGLGDFRLELSKGKNILAESVQIHVSMRQGKIKAESEPVIKLFKRA